MPRFDDRTKERLNSGFAERLERIDPPTIDVLVETAIGDAEEVQRRIADVPGIQFNQPGIVADQFIPVTIPEDSLPALTRVDGVKVVHQDQPVGVLQMPSPLDGDGAPEPPSVRDIPFLTPERDPIRSAASDVLFDVFTPEDTFVGRVGISPVEAPRFNFAQLPPGDPMQTLFASLDVLTGSNTTGREYIPTSESVAFVRNSSLTDGSPGAESKMAVLDTGHTPIEPANAGRVPRLYSAVPGEPPLDFHGHGSWCTYTAVGAAAPSTLGTTKGVAEQAQYGHFKCLNTFPGFGKTSWILDAIETAHEWGADVISMSLGGTQQGDVTEDPYAKVIDRFSKVTKGPEEGSIFVVAAGNSGPDAFTIGSPGVAPKAVTVGSWSLLDQSPAVFSSRGPQGAFYKDKPSLLSQHIDQFGAAQVVKPDLAAPGGGRENDTKAEQADEYLHQTETGWMEGLFDGFKDGRGLMHGTSQATPHAAGLILRLFEAGIIRDGAEVKQVLQNQQSVPDFPEAAANANESRAGKNIAVGFGALREALFEG